MAEQHIVSTPHGTLQFDGAMSNGEKAVLVTLSKPFFPAFSFCLSISEGMEVVAAIQDAIEDADYVESCRHDHP